MAHDQQVPGPREAPIPLTRAAAVEPRLLGSPAAPDVPLACVRRWATDRLRLSAPTSLPPLCKPTPPRFRKVRRSALEAWWSARQERAEIEEFLRGRLQGYLFRSQLPFERLPLDFVIEPPGRVRAVPPAAGRPSPEWLVAYLRANGEPALGVELRRAEVEVANLDRALAGCRERAVAAQRELDEAAHAPTLAADVRDPASAGRPPVPPPSWTAVAAVVALLLCAETALLAMPLLREAGIARDGLVIAWSTPERAVAPLLLALAASVSAFVFGSVATRRAEAVVQELQSRGRALAHGVASAASLTLVVSLAGSVVVARGATSLLLALVLPLAAPPLVAVARRLHASRALACGTAAEWDRVHQAAVSRWVRRREAVDQLEREQAALQASRAAWAGRAEAARRRIAEVDRLASEAADAEARELRSICDAILHALELDRRAWARHVAR